MLCKHEKCCSPPQKLHSFRRNTLHIAIYHDYHISWLYRNARDGMVLSLDSGGGPWCVVGMSSRAMQQGLRMHGLFNVTVSTSDPLSVREMVCLPLSCCFLLFHHPQVCVLVQAFVSACACACVCACVTVCVYIARLHAMVCIERKKLKCVLRTRPFSKPSGCRTRQLGRTWLLGPGVCSDTNKKDTFFSR